MQGVRTGILAMGISWCQTEFKNQLRGTMTLGCRIGETKQNEEERRNSHDNSVCGHMSHIMPAG
jgi:hypothetical protein